MIVQIKHIILVFAIFLQPCFQYQKDKQSDRLQRQLLDTINSRYGRSANQITYQPTPISQPQQIPNNPPPFTSLRAYPPPPPYAQGLVQAQQAQGPIQASNQNGQQCQKQFDVMISSVCGNSSSECYYLRQRLNQQPAICPGNADLEPYYNETVLILNYMRNYYSCIPSAFYACNDLVFDFTFNIGPSSNFQNSCRQFFLSYQQVLLNSFSQDCSNWTTSGGANLQKVPIPYNIAVPGSPSLSSSSSPSSSPQRVPEAQYDRGNTTQQGVSIIINITNITPTQLITQQASSIPLPSLTQVPTPPSGIQACPSYCFSYNTPFSPPSYPPSPALSYGSPTPQPKPSPQPQPSPIVYYSPQPIPPSPIPIFPSPVIYYSPKPPSPVPVPPMPISYSYPSPSPPQVVFTPPSSPSPRPSPILTYTPPSPSPSPNSAQYLFYAQPSSSPSPSSTTTSLPTNYISYKQPSPSPLNIKRRLKQNSIIQAINSAPCTTLDTQPTLQPFQQQFQSQVAPPSIILCQGTGVTTNSGPAQSQNIALPPPPLSTAILAFPPPPTSFTIFQNPAPPTPFTVFQNPTPPPLITTFNQPFPSPSPSPTPIPPSQQMLAPPSVAAICAQCYLALGLTSGGGQGQGGGAQGSVVASFKPSTNMLQVSNSSISTSNWQGNAKDSAQSSNQCAFYTPQTSQANINNVCIRSWITSYQQACCTNNNSPCYQILQTNLCPTTYNGGLLDAAAQEYFQSIKNSSQGTNCQNVFGSGCQQDLSPMFTIQNLQQKCPGVDLQKTFNSNSQQLCKALSSSRGPPQNRSFNGLVIWVVIMVIESLIYIF